MTLGPIWIAGSDGPWAPHVALRILGRWRVLWLKWPLRVMTI